jgi:hypothetical protein
LIKWLPSWYATITGGDTAIDGKDLYLKIINTSGNMDDYYQIH